ncbi:MAG: undecaprenyl-diphosphate phosphatase [Alphaproteobacteria bacterium]
MVRRTQRCEGRVSELHLVVLALVQGITEFLPISSSGHLILVPMLTGWPDQGLMFDVAVHVGTLGAVLLYFRRDVWHMLAGVARWIGGRRNPGAGLALLIVVATVPVVAAGAGLKYVGTDGLRNITVIGWTTLGFGVVLFAVDRWCLTVRRIEHMPVASAFAIGLAQVLALVPGTSRSGITMTAARALGYERQEAARFSLLLSIPVIIAAGALEGLELYETGDAGLTADVVFATALAFVSALAAIGFLMKWLRRASFTPFVIYRVGLGAYLLWLAYG